jgi:hypothetical protein
VDPPELVPQAVASIAAPPIPATWSNRRRETDDRIPLAIVAISSGRCEFMRFLSRRYLQLALQEVYLDSARVYLVLTQLCQNFIGDRDTDIYSGHITFL